MIQFRIRQWGEEEWCYLFLQGGPVQLVMQIIGAPLSNCSLHVQILNDEEEWEDFE